jgi:hypothetical protein
MALCHRRGIELWKTDSSLRPMPRNRQLASLCDVLIGAPPTEHLLKRGSGTWETIKYGFKYGKEVIVVTPSGAVHLEKDTIKRRP